MSAYGADCMQCRVRNFRNETQVHAAERDTAVAAASSALEWIKPTGVRRAEVAAQHYRVAEVNEALAWTRRENEKSACAYFLTKPLILTSM